MKRARVILKGIVHDGKMDRKELFTYAVDRTEELAVRIAERKAEPEDRSEAQAAEDDESIKEKLRQRREFQIEQAKLRLQEFQQEVIANLQVQSGALELLEATASQAEQHKRAGVSSKSSVEFRILLSSCHWN